MATPVAPSRTRVAQQRATGMGSYHQEELTGRCINDRKIRKSQQAANTVQSAPCLEANTDYSVSAYCHTMLCQLVATITVPTTGIMLLIRHRVDNHRLFGRHPRIKELTGHSALFSCCSL